jgi:hypothetical protein
MAIVGADIIVAHMGLTTASSIGAKMAVSLEDRVRCVQVITDVASEVNPDVCHCALSWRSELMILSFFHVIHLLHPVLNSCCCDDPPTMCAGRNDFWSY